MPGWSTIGVSSREVYATHHPKGSTPTGVAKSPRALLQIRESSVPVQIGTAIPRRVGPSVSSVGYTHLDAVTERVDGADHPYPTDGPIITGGAHEVKAFLLRDTEMSLGHVEPSDPLQFETTVDRRGRCYLNRQVRATRRRGAAVYAPPSCSKPHAITRATVRRASEAPRSSGISSGIDSIRKICQLPTESGVAQCTSIAKFERPDGEALQYTRPRHVQNRTRSRALLYDEQVKRHVAPE